MAFEFYGTVASAEDYFNHRLNTRAWDSAILKDRENSLIMATRLIDKLNFAGSIADETQTLQFPRDTDITVPLEIEYACFEIALKLLEGVDTEQEAQTIGVMSEAYSSVRTTYDGDYVNDHIRAGIPSIEAWGFLKPFLRDPKQLRVSRVN